MQQFDHFEKILKNVVFEKDLSSLSLKNSSDNFSKLCRAFVIKFYNNNKDYNESVSILNSLVDNLSLRLFNKFFNSDYQKLTFNHNRKNKVHIWDILCPEVLEAFNRPEETKDKILHKRKLTNLKESKNSLKNPTKEILFLSNVLITTPFDYLSSNIPVEIKDELQKFKNVKQSFWYDHPIPLDATINENEIIYGLKNLDEAMAFEAKRNNIKTPDKIKLILSVSVTHNGLEKIALEYVKLIIKKSLNLKFIEVYLFDEDICNKIYSAIFPKNDNFNSVLGVNGNYGRHYTFLKYILLIWNKVINTDFRYSFKIDLDQVFDQKILLKSTGSSILEIFKNQKFWGGTATDFDGRRVDLGMLAGALVNKNDISKDLFTPDVQRPKIKNFASDLLSKRIFCPEWPQSLSTEAELMYRSDDIQRIHVTGGTTGITVESLKRWAPFTPSFVNRAEDQAFVISSINQNEYLSHCHANNLIMRHDKHAFAQKSIEMSKFGKEIGNLERILIFSNYFEAHELDFEVLKEHFWPFTSVFSTKYAELLVGLVFLIDGCFNGEQYVSLGSKRLLNTQEYCKTKLHNQYKTEKQFWREFVDRLEVFNDKSNALKSIINSAKV